MIAYPQYEMMCFAARSSSPALMNASTSCCKKNEQTRRISFLRIVSSL